MVFILFSSFQAPPETPKTPQRVSKAPKDAPTTAKGSPKSSQGALKETLGALKELPRIPEDALRDVVGVIVGSFERVGDREEDPEIGNMQISILSIKPIEKHHISMCKDLPFCQEILRSTPSRSQKRPKETSREAQEANCAASGLSRSTWKRAQHSRHLRTPCGASRRPQGAP